MNSKSLLLRGMTLSLTSCGFGLFEASFVQIGQFAAGLKGAHPYLGFTICHSTQAFPQAASRPFWNGGVKGKKGSPPPGERRELRHREPPSHRKTT